MFSSATTLEQTSNTSTDIHRFFETLYGKAPIVSQDKKNTIYAIPGNGISIITDAYGGCHIDVKAAISVEQLGIAQKAIETLSESFKTRKAFDSIWIDVALPSDALILGSIAPSSFRIGEPGEGDLIYDYQQKKIRIWHWLNSDKECAIPPGATHNIGATALILDMAAKKLLLVVNVRRDDSWNLPGGSFDPLKDNAPSYTALREALEEGGFELEKSAAIEPRLIGQMQFPFNQFAPAINQIWAYFIDGISQKPLNPPINEILLAEWVSFDDILASKGSFKGLKISEEIQSSLIAAINGSGFEKIVDKKWMIVHVAKSDSK